MEINASHFSLAHGTGVAVKSVDHVVRAELVLGLSLLVAVMSMIWNMQKGDVDGHVETLECEVVVNW